MINARKVFLTKTNLCSKTLRLENAVYFSVPCDIFHIQTFCADLCASRREMTLFKIQFDPLIKQNT